MTMNAPTHETHIPVKAELPPEPETTPERDFIAPPTIWTPGLKCKHKVSGREAVVFRVDLGTMQFRPFWPDKNEYGSRTEWVACSDFWPETELSPKERARQEAAEKLAAEMGALEAEELENVNALVDGDDPFKALAKIKALRNMGVIKGKPSVLAAAVEGKKK